LSKTRQRGASEPSDHDGADVPATSPTTRGSASSAATSPGTTPAVQTSQSPVEQGTRLAQELAAAFREHVRRAIGMGLDDSETSLAYVDHYLRTVRNETRAPIVALIAAEAGAYYGELVRATMGGTWIGDGADPRRLRLLLQDQFLYFSPVDQAWEALLGPRAGDDEADDDDGDDDDDDERSDVLPETRLDTTFHARRGLAPPPADPVPIAAPDPDEGDDDPNAFAAAEAMRHAASTTDDATWLADRLAELPSVPEDEYYSLTCRFETLKLVLELIATKHVAEGRRPRQYHIADYVDALADRQRTRD
jgi:hypothetical protein